MANVRDEYFVEKILAHRGDIGRLKTLTFHVKWRGYDESFNSWEPWKNLRETEQLHRYLIANGMQRLIPAKFRDNTYPELGAGVRRWPYRNQVRWSVPYGRPVHCYLLIGALGQVHGGTSGNGASLLMLI